MPDLFRKPQVSVFQRLEAHYRDMQDVEFTIENGKLWILQTRSGKRTAEAALAHRGRSRRGRRDLASAPPCCASSRARSISSCIPTLDPDAKKDVDRQGAAGLARRRRRRDRLHRR